MLSLSLSFSPSLSLSLSHTHTHTHTYTYRYMTLSLCGKVSVCFARFEIKFDGVTQEEIGKMTSSCFAMR